jgi:hypothetical protein
LEDDLGSIDRGTSMNFNIYLIEKMSNDLMNRDNTKGLKNFEVI